MMIRVIMYIMETNDFGLHIKSTKSGRLFQLRHKADSEFCEDKETRISVYGFILYFCGDPRW